MRCYAELPSDCLIRGSKATFQAASSDSTGATEYLVSNFFDAPTIKDAFFAGLDLMEELLDRIAFVSNSPAWATAMLSVTVPASRVGEDFDLALLHGAFSQKTVPVDKERLEGLDAVTAGSPEAVALRSFREGITTPNPFKACTDLWKAVEALAEPAAKAAGHRLNKLCPACGTEVESRPAAQPVIRERVGELAHFKSPDDAVKAADAARSFRGKLVHGGKLADESLREEAESHWRILRPTAAASLSKATGVKPVCRVAPHLGVPMVVLKLRRTGNNATDFQEVPGTSYAIRAGISEIPAQYADDANCEIFFGIKPPIPIDPRGMPDLLV